MAVHFLLSAAARTLSLREIYKAGEDAAYETFKGMRWTDGEPVCPKCGSVEAYEITTRRKFKCKGCTHQRGGSVCLNRLRGFAKWIVCRFMPLPGLASAR